MRLHFFRAFLGRPLTSPIFLTLSLFLLTACRSEPTGGYVISGTVEGLTEGKVCLSPFMAEGVAHTVDLVEGSFRFQGRVERPHVYALSLEGQAGKLLFFLGNEEVEISASCLAAFTGTASSPCNALWDRFGAEGAALDSTYRRSQDPEAALQRAAALKAFKRDFVQQNVENPVGAMVLLHNLHHFSPEEATALLVQMQKAAALADDGNVKELSKRLASFR